MFLKFDFSRFFGGQMSTCEGKEYRNETFHDFLNFYRGNVELVYIKV